MIIAKVPLRITLAGGGSDLPSFADAYGSHVISMAINKYIYIVLNRNYKKNIILKYSKFEQIDNVSKIKHNLIKNILIHNKIKNHIELSSFAELPAQSGLGSSGSFAVGLIGALKKFRGLKKSIEDVAYEAYQIESNLENKSIGYQDHFISAFGKISEFKSKNSLKIIKSSLNIDKIMIDKIEKSFFVVNTNISRKAPKVLIMQDISKKNNKKKIANYIKIYDLAAKMRKALLNNDIEEYSNLNNQHWQNKLEKGNFIVSKPALKIIDDLMYENIFHSSKLIGAGYGGHILGISMKPKNTERYLKNKGYKFFKIKVSEGLKIQNL